MAGTGPAANPFSRRSRSGANGTWAKIPSTGYEGPIPDWPLNNDPSDAEWKIWTDVWRTPQACMWVNNGLERTVARYVMASALVEIEPTAGMMAEVRHLDDRLGLSSMALRKLQWEVEAPSENKLAEVTNIDRFANL